MKNKIFSFIIGVLVGAIVATACYYFYAKYNTTAVTNPNGNVPEMGNMQEPPEMGNGTNGQRPENMQGEPPAKPDEENNSNTNSKNEKNNDTKSNEIKSNSTKNNESSNTKTNETKGNVINQKGE